MAELKLCLSFDGCEMIIPTPSFSTKSYVKHLSGPLPAKISKHLFFITTDTSRTHSEISFMLVKNDQILQEVLKIALDLN